MNNLARHLYSIVTNKEREVIECLMQNMTRKEIAHVLDITTNSYDTLVARIKKRWGTGNINSIINIISRYYKNDITTDLW
jgi:DNA-binding CsgD family transcriptional regulator